MSLSWEKVPCGACNHLGWECVSGCMFMPYFPPNDGDQFAVVDKVFGGRNVAKCLAEFDPEEREKAVKWIVDGSTERPNNPSLSRFSAVTDLQSMLVRAKGHVAAARAKFEFGGGHAPALPTYAALTWPVAKQTGEAKLPATSGLAVEQDDAMRAGEAMLKPGRPVAEKAPCAGCDHLRRELADHVAEFVFMNKVFGASNVTMYLAEFEQGERANAVERLVDKAITLRRDPDFTRFNTVAVLKNMLKEAKNIAAARVEFEFDIGQVPAFQPFDPVIAPPVKKQTGQAQLSATQNQVGSAMQKQGRAVAEKDAVVVTPQPVAGWQQHHVQDDHYPAMGLTRDQNYADLRQKIAQQIANAQQLSAAANVAREQQRQAGAYAHAMPGSGFGATTMPLQSGLSADAPPFFVQQQRQPQPQTVNAAGSQEDASLPPWLAYLPRQQQNGDGDKGQSSDRPDDSR